MWAVLGADGIWRLVPNTGPVVGTCGWCNQVINQSGAGVVSYDPVQGVFFHAACGAVTPNLPILVTQ